MYIEIDNNSRNPYFIGINSAIDEKLLKKTTIKISRNPYFIGINSAIEKRIQVSNI